jgi:hypothetical protein
VSQEIEAAAGDALGGFFRFHRHKEEALPLGAPCANCATPLQGPWCYQCGQLGEDYHRSIGKLIVEVFEGLLHFDGRVWRTLPDLFRHPGKLTRAYLDGHRAPQVPPFRLFLVVLVLIFFAGSIGGQSIMSSTTIVTDDHGKVLSVRKNTLETMTPSDKDQVKAAINQELAKPDGEASSGVSRWLLQRSAKVMDDPERFKLVLEQWSERFAFLLLPLAAGLLSLLFLRRKEFFVFDHTIFSLHSLSAAGLMFAVASALAGVTADASYVILWAAPVHLFFHMRGVYRTSVLATLVRMALLFLGSSVGVAFIITGLIAVGLNGMGS